MEIFGAEYFAEDVIRTQRRIANEEGRNVTIEEATAITKAAYEYTAYERYLVAKLEKSK